MEILRGEYSLIALSYVIEFLSGARLWVPRDVAGQEYRDSDYHRDAKIERDRLERIAHLGLGLPVAEPAGEGRWNL